MSVPVKYPSLEQGCPDKVIPAYSDSALLLFHWVSFRTFSWFIFFVTRQRV